MRSLALFLLALLTSCAVVYVDDGTGGQGGTGGSAPCPPASHAFIAKALGYTCDTDCDSPLSREEVVSYVMRFASQQGTHAGYYMPDTPTFQDVGTDSKVEEGVFAQVVLPEPYDGTAKFYPSDPADSCFTAELADRVKALPTLYITPLESFPGFEVEAFDGSKTEVMSYTLHGSSKEEPLYYVRLINDPSNQFVSGSQTNAIEKAYVVCQSGTFSSERLLPWPMDGKEAMAEAPENCFDHGGGVVLTIYVSPAFSGEAVIGLALSSPVRKWPNWQDSKIPATMTVK